MRLFEWLRPHCKPIEKVSIHPIGLTVLRSKSLPLSASSTDCGETFCQESTQFLYKYKSWDTF